MRDVGRDISRDAPTDGTTGQLHLAGCGPVDQARLGLARTFSDRPVTLLYLFWEPANAEASPVFAAHRAEISEFAARMTGSSPTFEAMSYPELWQS